MLSPVSRVIRCLNSAVVAFGLGWQCWNGKTWPKWQRSLKTAMRPENGIRLSIWPLQRRRSVQRSWGHSEPTRPPSCVARWERGGCAALRCHSRKWESAVCGALVGTLSNKKEFPTTTSSSEVADHREVSQRARDRVTGKSSVRPSVKPPHDVQKMTTLPHTRRF